MPNFTVKVLSTVAPSAGETMDTFAPSGAGVAAIVMTEAPINTEANATRDSKAFMCFSDFFVGQVNANCLRLPGTVSNHPV